MQKLQVPTASTAASGVLLAMQGLSTVMAAFLVLATRPYSRIPFVDTALSGARSELALGLVVFAFILFLVAFAVASLEGWARVVALVLEGLMLAGALFRFPAHPVWSLAAGVVCVAAIVLLLTDSAWDADETDVASTPGGEALGAAN